MTKACRKCGEVKPLEDFKLCGGGRWRVGACMACDVERHRQRRKRLANPVSVTEKECAACGEVKPASAFHRVPANADGLRGHCRECHKALPCMKSDARQVERRKYAVKAGRAYRTEQSIKTGQRFREHLRRVEAALRGRWPASAKAERSGCCCVCGREFTTTAPRRKYCGQRCSWRALRSKRRARMRKVFVEEVNLNEVYFRDGGRCKLCGKKVDQAKRYPHAGAAVLDHIVPISRGGKHERANVQLAHHGCNSHKGAGSCGSQLLLVG